MTPLDSLVVIVMAIVALAGPFILPRAGSLPVKAADIEAVFGPRSWKRTLFATIMLVVTCLGVLAAFASNSASRFTLAVGAPFLALLWLAVIVPEGRPRKLVVKLLELDLVVWAIAVAAIGTHDLWVAGHEGRVPLGRMGGGWIDVREDSYFFWYTVSGWALLVFVALYGLREYFAQVFQRRAHKKR
ncbi:hypothetical protein BWI17_04735 [Betaproteobacteria bacterium GR16-43]|nr:hypothetical protein BWI17_04735 [Betaproteobacteria bacterium GR16-43]